MDPDLVTRILTRERMRLVMHLKRHGPCDSLRELADGLERNYSSVSRDLRELVEMGLVGSQRHGKQKRIHATGRPVIIA